MIELQYVIEGIGRVCQGVLVDVFPSKLLIQLFHTNVLCCNFKVRQRLGGHDDGMFPAAQSSDANIPRGAHAKVGLGSG